MKKFVAILFAVVMVCSTALPAAISASAVDTSSLAGTTINVYNWGEYISDGSEGSMDVNAEFTKRTGIRSTITITIPMKTCTQSLKATV